MGFFDKFLKKKDYNIKSADKINIELDRDSVCMGDDCMSHKLQRNFDRKMMISDFLEELSIYVPSMFNVVWSVSSKNCINKVIGYIVTDQERKVTIELSVSDMELDNIFIDKTDIRVFCRYYYKGRFSWIEGNTKQLIEKYSECKTLLEKVKIDCES